MGNNGEFENKHKNYDRMMISYDSFIVVDSRGKLIS